MKQHKAIIVGERNIWESFNASYPKTYWDYENKFEVIIDKPILDNHDSLFLSKPNKIVRILNVIKTDGENTIMYQVEGLYDEEYSGAYKEKSKKYNELRKILLNRNLSKGEFEALDTFKANSQETMEVNDYIYELYKKDYNIIKKFFGFEFEVKGAYGIGYFLTKKDSLEGILLKRLNEIECELQNIKSKWWYKSFNRVRNNGGYVKASIVKPSTPKPKRK